MKEQSSPTFRSFVILVIVVVIAWLSWPWISSHAIKLAPGSDQLSNLGLFGDSFGGLNALFTGVALAAVAWAGFLQHSEIQHQRAALAKQSFENTFFNVLGLLTGLSERAAVGSSRGMDAIQWMANYASHIVTEVGSTDAAEARLIYAALYERHVFKAGANYLAPFFRTLYTIFRLIDEHEHLTDAEKVTYANIVRAQMDNNAVILLAANCSNPDLGADFIPLVEKYHLIKHLPFDPFREFMERILPAQAFASR